MYDGKWGLSQERFGSYADRLPIIQRAKSSERSMEILNNVEPYHLLMAKVFAGKRRSIFTFSTSLFSATLIIGCASNDASANNKFQNMRYGKWKNNSYSGSATGRSNNKKINCGY
jgi:hypothetical protein